VIYKSLFKTPEKQSSKCDERRDLRKMKRKEKGLAKHLCIYRGLWPWQARRVGNRKLAYSRLTSQPPTSQCFLNDYFVPSSPVILPTRYSTSQQKISITYNGRLQRILTGERIITKLLPSVNSQLEGQGTYGIFRQ